MSSIDSNFDDLVNKIERGGEFSSTSFEPVYYLIFEPSEILAVKKKQTAWESRLRNKNFEPAFFSIADAVLEIHAEAKQRRFWLAADQASPLDWGKVNNSLRVALEPKADGTESPLQSKIEAKLKELESVPNAILLITDLEALHPYIRIGAIEGQLYGKFKIPTVFLYPGKRSGKTSLSFLGFYPDDGNYRSVHVGG